MFALFDTLEEYLGKNTEISEALGYPDGNGTDRYSEENPCLDVNGRYVMQVLPHVEIFFDDCLVESVEYPQEVDDEID